MGDSRDHALPARRGGEQRLGRTGGRIEPEQRCRESASSAGDDEHPVAGDRGSVIVAGLGAGPTFPAGSRPAVGAAGAWAAGSLAPWVGPVPDAPDLGLVPVGC